jgi:hypothetical protein
MRFRTLFDSMKHRRSGTPVRRKPSRPTASRLRVEALEGRCLPSFLGPVNYSVGSFPTSIVAADFNHDAVLDLAVANPSSSSVLLGNADGTFQQALNSPGAAAPRSLAVGDFNADGKLDLATANAGEVSVLLGDGNGTFQAPISSGIGPDYMSVSVGDFNTDGKLDLAVTSNLRIDDGYGYYGGHYYHDESRASILLGNGTGSFADPIASSVGYGYFLVSAAAGDFNTDGKLDLAVASNGGAVILLPGTGAGTFGIPTSFHTGYYSSSVAAGDVNADGKLDLVTANPQGNNVSVLLGTGAGSFGAAQNYTAGSQPQTDWGCESVTMADFNGDGRLDLVTANGDTETVSVLLGTGAGTFQPPVSATADSWPYGVVAGDFNGDGRPDVAYGSNNVSNNVSVLLNDGTWPPLPPPSVSVNDVTVTEGNTGTVNATFTVTLLYASPVDVTVHYDTANITAMAGSDYAAVSGEVIIAAGQTTRTFTVGVIGDRSTEPTETFVVNLSGATNATIADGQGVGTIVDDEPRISISDVTKKEGNGKRTTLFVFTVTLSAAYDQAVAVSYRTADGTATTGDGDYVARTGTLTFAPGETTKTITIEVKGDGKKEANEYFHLDLFDNSSNSLFTKSHSLGTILNDD